ncbi:MAG: hypothetical protein CMA63_06655 [Euryarchaeota archaeon]|nr:hypothetical protein [Euryarchaeota archaeon]|tara:strand:+ start:410 stop:949 length:540 start_codon:yes stop_codon:yes gene_type:complete
MTNFAALKNAAIIALIAADENAKTPGKKTKKSDLVDYATKIETLRVALKSDAVVTMKTIDAVVAEAQKSFAATLAAETTKKQQSAEKSAARREKSLAALNARVDRIIEAGVECEKTQTIVIDMSQKSLADLPGSIRKHRAVFYKNGRIGLILAERKYTVSAARCKTTKNVTLTLKRAAS